MENEKKDTADKGQPSANSGNTGKLPPPGLEKIPRNARQARKYLGRLLSAFQRGLVDDKTTRTSVYILQVMCQITLAAEIEPRLAEVEKRLEAKK
jgi:hypothetical protein